LKNPTEPYLIADTTCTNVDNNIQNAPSFPTQINRLGVFTRPVEHYRKILYYALKAGVQQQRTAADIR